MHLGSTGFPSRCYLSGGVGVQVIVRVEKDHNFTSTSCKACVQSCALPLIDRLQQSFDCSSIATNNISRTVRGCVVDNNNLTRIELRKSTIYGPRKVSRIIEIVDNDRDERWDHLRVHPRFDAAGSLGPPAASGESVGDWDTTGVPMPRSSNAVIPAAA